MNGEKTEPRVEIIDERHQKFNGVIYTRDKNSGHYSREFLLHRVVWQHFFGETPKGFDVHHRDCDPSNNDISNMMLLTRAEHRKLHWHPEKWYVDHPEALEPIKIEGDHPTPVVLDEKHQRFDGMTFGLRQSGHYSAHIPLHCAIWSYFNGEIPIGCVIHHRDLNPANNELENLQLMTDSAHKKLHGALKSVEGKKDGAPSYEKDPVRSQAVMLQWQRRKAEENLIEKVCLNCGNTFKTPFARTRYCSHKCARQFRNRKDDDAKLAPDEFRGEDGRIYKKGICEYCGKEFVYLRKRRSKCCSQSCYSKYLWRERNREANLFVKHCRYCGKEFKTTIERACFCSDNCAHKHKRQHREEPSSEQA